MPGVAGAGVAGETRAGLLAGLRAAVKDAAGAAPYLPSGVDYVEDLRAVELERRRVIEQRR